MLLNGLLRLMFPIVLALVVPAIAADSGIGDRNSFAFRDSDRRLIREQELLDADQHIRFRHIRNFEQEFDR